MTDDAKRGGYPGSGDGTTMGPPAPTPSGSPPATEPGSWAEPVHPAWGEQFSELREPLSEAKVVALTKAVELVGANGIPDPGEGGSETSEIIAIAKEFEAYLLGQEAP